MQSVRLAGAKRAKRGCRWDGIPRDFPGGLRFAFSKLPDGHWLPSLVAASKQNVRGKNKYKLSDGTIKTRSFKGELAANEVVYWLVH